MSEEVSTDEKFIIPGKVAVKQFGQRKHRLILREENLTAENGIRMLPEIVSNTKFKGKGHELDDLKLLISKTKHWAHRLFPTATFEDFIEKAEQLGHKKQVRGYVYRLRRDAVPSNEEIMEQFDNEDDNDENDEENRSMNPLTTTIELVQDDDNSSQEQSSAAKPTVNKFDEIFGAEIEQYKKIKQNAELNKVAEDINFDMSDDEDLAQLF